MSESRQVNVEQRGVSKVAFVVLGLVSIVALFMVAFDQGHTFSLVYGDQAFVDQYLHELTHDIRHASGFPCH